ncbi:divergent polysaccharide deacetylase family protein [Actibacterium pelagium]|uniref:Divergent polysaccharide deacetylase n=1 Tax=Actibacterium pelagium TaxID=2029103 RepID=A0A917AD97_9RHOB|nr:divergent polysaccharide deacetylase family protein [Actibacterium pelagium]GGE41787.1 hypothetical protein GCM10011517_06750 [Actibacterium pelagium]
MGKGFLGGVIMGLIVSLCFLLIISSVSPLRTITRAPAPASDASPLPVQGQAETLTAQSVTVEPAEDPEPTPERSTGVQSTVELGTGSAFGQPEAEPEITIEPAQLPEADDEAPLANTESVAVPTVNDAVEEQSEGGAPSVEAAPGNTLTNEPALPSPAVPAPQAPPAPESPVVLPDVTDLVVATPAPAASEPVEAEAESAPEAETPVEESPASEEEQSAAPQEAEEPKVAVNRLPSVGAEAEPEATEEAEPVVAEVFTRALDANAEEFEIAADIPLLAVVLRDVGQGGVALPAWKDVRMPITFAVDPTQEGAAEQAQAYRDAGYEVVLLATELPSTGVSGDVAGTVAEYMAKVPSTVALMPEMEKTISRPVMRQLVEAAATTGHGLVTSGKGLVRPEQLAEGTNVPVVSVSRVLDAEGDDAAKQRFALNKAVFDASQNGAAVVYAHTHPWTYVTLLEWALSGSTSSGVQAVPLSAVLKAVE